MNRPISTTTHGVIDYVTVGTLATLPRVLKWNPRLTNLLSGSAASILGYSLLTDYELSLRKMIPMKTHLALDGVSALLVGAAPFIARERRKDAIFALLGIAVCEATVTALTRTRPTVKSRIARLLGRQAPIPVLAKTGWQIGKQSKPSTISRATAALTKLT
jgi:hypothetical protein